MSGYKTVIGTSIIATSLLAGGITGVLAAKGPGHGQGTGGGLIGYGTLSALSSTSATVATPSNGSLVISLAANASYTARSQGAAVAGLKTGDQVALRGTSVNGAGTARSVEFDTSAFAAASVRLSGAVSSSSATSLTLTTSTGQSVTVQLDSATRYGTRGSTAGARPTFTANQQVRVSASQYTDGSLVARSVTLPTSTASASATATASS